MKEVLEKGITVISTDFNIMGVTSCSFYYRKKIKKD